MSTPVHLVSHVAPRWSAPAWPARRSCRSARFGASPPDRRRSRSARIARSQGTAASPAGWRTWLLTSPDELRPAAPGAPTQAEIDEVVAAQADPSDGTTAAIARWGGRPAVIPWTDLAGEVFVEFKVSAGMPSRAMALLHTALHDAVIAAWDAQVAHARPSPGATSDQITPAAGVDPTRPSFPSEHAAVAGAAATVLAYLLPDAAPGRFDALATEAAESRIAAGAAFRSDVEAGLALGQAVGEKAVARAKGDGSDAEWDGSSGRLTGPGFWEPTPPGFVETPAFPLAGTWQTWVMTSGDQVRPAPPPEYGSPAWKAELAVVQEACANRSFEQERAAHFWTGRSPATPRRRSGAGSPRADRARRARPAARRAGPGLRARRHRRRRDRRLGRQVHLVDVAPDHRRPGPEVLFPTPPYPSYPSGHSRSPGRRR